MLTGEIVKIKEKHLNTRFKLVERLKKNNNIPGAFQKYLRLMDLNDKRYSKEIADVFQRNDAKKKEDPMS